MRRHGFTLIELLVVLAVMASLAAMLAPMLQIARRKADEAATRGLLARIDAALGRFHTETGTWPYQGRTDADTDLLVGNDLARRLAHQPTGAELALLRGDLADADTAYATGAVHALVAPARPYDPTDGGPPDTTPDTDIDPRVGTPQVKTIPKTQDKRSIRMRELHARLTNRLATERLRLAVLAGNPQIPGIRPRAPADGVVPGRSPAASTTVLNPASRGFCADYLSGEIEARAIGGDQLLDRYGRPLVYICPVVGGVGGLQPASPMIRPTERSYGGTENLYENTPLDPSFYRLGSLGRQLATSRSSDLRFTAARPFLHRFELWSAGRDGTCAVLRDDPSNRDNVSAGPYLEGLP